MRRLLTALFISCALSVSAFSADQVKSKVAKGTKPASKGTYLLTNRGTSSGVLRVEDTRSGKLRVGVLGPARVLPKATPDGIVRLDCSDGTQATGYIYASPKYRK